VGTAEDFQFHVVKGQGHAAIDDHGNLVNSIMKRRRHLNQNLSRCYTVGRHTDLSFQGHGVKRRGNMCKIPFFTC